jgi:hypothetical protein
MENNPFCAISRGAQEISERQIRNLNQRMADILSTVELEWSKEAPHPVPAPEMPSVVEKPAPRQETRPAVQPRATVALR